MCVAVVAVACDGGDAGSANATADAETSPLGSLATRLAQGDVGVLADVLRIGLEGATRQDEAVAILVRHEPLRTALGIRHALRADEPVVVADGLPMLRAADEWHREVVLGQPSPWRPMPPTFGQPFAAEKRSSFGILTRLVAESDDIMHDDTGLRLHAVAPARNEEDAQRDLVLITGHGHDDSLTIHTWSAAHDPVVGLQFASRYGHVLDCKAFALDRTSYAAMIAGLHVALAARVEPWWNGPSKASWSMSFDFVVAVTDAESNPPTHSYRGWRDSVGRVRYLPLLAAAEWHDRFVTERARPAPLPARSTLAARFSASVRGMSVLRPDPVGERFTSLAERFGDDSLRGMLGTFLEPELPFGRSATMGAIRALAAITRVDLRRNPDGTARELAEVVAAYRTLLQR